MKKMDETNHWRWSKRLTAYDSRFVHCRTYVHRHPYGKYTINGLTQYEHRLERTFELTTGVQQRLEVTYTKEPIKPSDNVTRSVRFQYLLPERIARFFRLSGDFVWFKVETGASM
jgi:hypothetical protein